MSQTAADGDDDAELDADAEEPEIEEDLFEEELRIDGICGVY
ncbi:mycofactocin precursor MftA [Halobacterium wangiae]|nr:mycofactocin precursor MftA [Halobacterium wangiae]